jgi:hypothetical protein
MMVRQEASSRRSMHGRVNVAGFIATLMKAKHKDWFGKSDVGIYSEMPVRRFRKGGPRGAREASDGFEH